METLKEIVNGTMAKLTHICNGKAYYKIDTENHSYQLEIDIMNMDEWRDVYVQTEYKSITLMRWIRKGITANDDSFMVLK